ncbi:hypothetical protein F7R12_12360 [Pseudomonas tolaasii]|nr:hypothetical protein F7R12_12360 [Pseudomonas tolaasii]
MPAMQAPRCISDTEVVPSQASQLLHFDLQRLSYLLDPQTPSYNRHGLPEPRPTACYPHPARRRTALMSDRRLLPSRAAPRTPRPQGVRPIKNRDHTCNDRQGYLNEHHL